MKKINKYLSEDGKKVFDTEEECLQYENEVSDYKSLSQAFQCYDDNLNLITFPDFMFYPEFNEEDSEEWERVLNLITYIVILDDDKYSQLIDYFSNISNYAGFRYEIPDTLPKCRIIAYDSDMEYMRNYDDCIKEANTIIDNCSVLTSKRYRR